MSLGMIRNLGDAREQQRLESWNAGRIVVIGGRLDRIERRLFGYRASRLRVWWDQRFKLGSTRQLRSEYGSNPSNRCEQRDECQLFYHHGWLSADFLVLGYVKSWPAASLSTFYLSLLVLDEIARLKGSHAIVAEVTNHRISDRLLARWGWERHCGHLPGRHFIKRFYGTYPPHPELWHVAFGRSSSPESGQLLARGTPS